MKLIHFLMFFLLLLPTVQSIEIFIVDKNSTLIEKLFYDRFNGTGSLSYKDNSLRNPNVYLRICGIDYSFVGNFVNLLYASESGNITIGLLSILPKIYNVTQNCTTVDIDISSFEALYPALPYTSIVDKNMRTLYIVKLNQSMNGSYAVGIDVDDIEKVTYISIQKIYDDVGYEITNATKDNIIVSIVVNNVSIVEGRTSPRSGIRFDYQFKSNEIVYVNGIPSLYVKVVDPCTEINETGYYYLLNSSAWNVKESCLTVRNVSNIVVDFANKTIDGDGEVNGSYRGDVCGITVLNVENVTLKDVRIQEFSRGICVFNSSNVKILGTSDQYNVHGIYVYNSSVKVSRMKFYNNDSEIYGFGKSLLTLYQTYFMTANLSVTAQDVVMRNVFNPPPDPPGLVNIGQWVYVAKTGLSWIYRITFHFIFPNPDNIIPKSIYRFNGTYINGTWYNQSWDPLIPTYVDVANREIFADINITNFSIIAPYGEEIPPTPTPTPTPVPTPTPTPAEVTGIEERVVPPLINLTLHVSEVTLQQGEATEIGFNLTNEGEAGVEGVVVIPEVRRGWLASSVEYEYLSPGETKVGKFYLQVYENEIPGTYYVPVKAVLKRNNATVDVEILKVIVVPRKRVARISILEIPPFLSLPELSKNSVGILIKNTGDYDLHNLRLIIEGGEDCIEKVEGVFDLKVGEEKSLKFTLYTKKAPAKCKTVFVFRSSEGLVGFYPVIITVVPSKIAKVFAIFKILNVVLIVWTVVTIYVLKRK